ncbi:hypothetical protein KIW84_MT0014 (mitochondrion) [Lathyrus oleraceus]|nr:hypothetical protein KIW84_MT0014 [Pisum sativum]
MFNLFLAVSPEIFIINATSILLIHGVVFSTSKKYDYPPLVSNVGWLGLLSVSRLGGQRALGCGGAKQLERMNVRGAKKAQLPNLMRHRVRTAGNRSMGGCLILLQPQGWLIVRSWLEYPSREERRAVDDNEKRRRVWTGGMDERKVPWSEEYPESHVRQLNAPRGAAEELGDLLEHRIGN